MNVRFWGVRGSVPVHGPETVRTGGRTTCLEVEHQGERLILDGGTGLQALGNTFDLPTNVHILYTHVHWDHIQGVPFFRPLYDAGSHITMLGRRSAWGSLRDALEAQMRPPTFPVTLDAFQAQLDFIDIDPGHRLEIGPFRITPAPMNHPDGVLVYRIEAGGRSMVFATDVEHGASLDSRLVEFCEGTDLLVHDAHLTNDEYFGLSGPSKKGWGHSTWQQAVDTALACNAGRLAMVHHDPMRTDAAVESFESAAIQRMPTAQAAREGQIIKL